MSDTFELKGRQIVLQASSDRVVAERVLRHIQRRIDEDYWRPYTFKLESVEERDGIGRSYAQQVCALELI